MSNTHAGGHIHVDPDALKATAAEYDAVADRIEAELAAHGQALHVAPSGRDEVSAIAADWFNKAADTFIPAAKGGVHELRKAAALLRQQADKFSSEDEALGAKFTQTL
ncbi:MAG: PE family protein [Mycobacteriaceae bacterium]